MTEETEFKSEVPTVEKGSRILGFKWENRSQEKEIFVISQLSLAIGEKKTNDP